VLVSGASTNVAAQCPALSTAPGSLDTCFGVNGYVQTDVTGVGAFQGGRVVRAQVDGKLVVGGASRVAGSSGSELFIARYLPNGSLDDTFGGGDGFVKTNLTASTTDSESLQDLVIDGSGRVVVAAQMPAVSSRGNAAFAVLRYTTNGTLDTTFGGSGIVSFGFENRTDAYARTLALRSTGQIVVAGQSGGVLAVAQLKPDGALDSAFGGGGKATFASVVDRRQGPSIYSMVIDGSGRAVLAGNLYQDSLIVRLTPVGALDSSFAGKGWTTVDYYGGGGDYFNAVAITADGKIIAAGRADTPVYKSPPLIDVALVRFLGTGVLDGGFGAAGKVTLDLGGTIDIAHGLVLQADGRIVVSAEATAPDYTTADNAVARFTADGSLDVSFGTLGVTLTDFAGAYTQPYNLVAQNDGGVAKVVVLSTVAHATSVGLTRYFAQ